MDENLGVLTYFQFIKILSFTSFQYLISFLKYKYDLPMNTNLEIKGKL